IRVKLEAMGLEAAPPADRLTLIRRATFDMLGLPPSPDEVDTFAHDRSPDGEAFARVVERLLASPRYGEQWGRHWLDVVRYADSSGLANDYERPNAWRYRDYVVRSFNADKPYDRFVREQIAGDELDPTDPELLVAVGFLRMGAWELTGMEVAKLARQRFLDDATDAVGQVFLGHMLQCARCHDPSSCRRPTWAWSGSPARVSNGCGGSTTGTSRSRCRCTTAAPRSCGRSTPRSASRRTPTRASWRRRTSSPAATRSARRSG